MTDYATNSLPLNVPNQPAFGREIFKHEIKTLAEGYAYDDLYTMNTQSGTQWDGFRHFAHMATGSFYNGVCEFPMPVSNFNFQSQSQPTRLIYVLLI